VQSSPAAEPFPLGPSVKEKRERPVFHRGADRFKLFGPPGLRFGRQYMRPHPVLQRCRHFFRFDERLVPLALPQVRQVPQLDPPPRQLAPLLARPASICPPRLNML